MHWHDREPTCNNRTSAAKAVHALEVYGTAEAVPFVQMSLSKHSPPRKGWDTDATALGAPL